MNNVCAFSARASMLSAGVYEHTLQRILQLMYFLYKIHYDV